MENETRIAVEREREQLTERAKRAAEQAALAVLNAEPSSSSSSVSEVITNNNMQVQQYGDAISGRLAFNLMIDSLPKYDATTPTQTIQRWIARVEEDAVINGWNEHEKFLAAKRALMGAAKRWYDSQEGVRSWESLHAGLFRAFEIRQTKFSDIHEILRNRKRKKDETVIEFVHEMESLHFRTT